MVVTALVVVPACMFAALAEEERGNRTGISVVATLVVAAALTRLTIDCPRFNRKGSLCCSQHITHEKLA